jgi:hypothetical protein
LRPDRIFEVSIRFLRIQSHQQGHKHLNQRGTPMSFRLTFRRTEKECLHVVAHPDPPTQGTPAMIVDFADPTAFTTAVGLAGVGTEFESTLSVAAEEAWKNHGIEVCCEAVALMTGQLDSLGFRPKH